jgi:hypothetical protein
MVKPIVLSSNPLRYALFSLSSSLKWLAYSSNRNPKCFSPCNNFKSGIHDPTPRAFSPSISHTFMQTSKGPIWPQTSPKGLVLQIKWEITTAQF